MVHDAYHANRTLDNRIDGVVITFTDVTASRKTEMELREREAELESKIKELKRELEKIQKKSKDGNKIN